MKRILIGFVLITSIVSAQKNKKDTIYYRFSEQFLTRTHKEPFGFIFKFKNWEDKRYYYHIHKMHYDLKPDKILEIGKFTSRVVPQHWNTRTFMDWRTKEYLLLQHQTIIFVYDDLFIEVLYKKN